MVNVMAYAETRAEAARLMPILAAVRSAGRNTAHIRPGQDSPVASISHLFGLSDQQQVLSPTDTSPSRRASAIHRLLREQTPDALLIHPASATSSIAHEAVRELGIPLVSIDSWPVRKHPSSADLYLESHELHRQHLIKTGLPDSAVSTIGSTTTDCFLRGVAQAQFASDQYRTRTIVPQLRQAFRSGKQLDLLISQRLERLRPQHLNRYIQEFANDHSARTIIFSVTDPQQARRVRASVDTPNLVITGPLDYQDYCRALARSTAVATDVPSIQRDALTLNKQILPVATGRRTLWPRRHQQTAEPQPGDGLAALRGAEIIMDFLHVDPTRPQDSSPYAHLTQSVRTSELQRTAAC